MTRRLLLAALGLLAAAIAVVIGWAGVVAHVAAHE